MTDRELLEMAAKAAGLHHCGWDEEDQAITAWFDDPSDTLEGGAWGKWNPLTDDGDALRLAVKLRINIYNPLGDADVSASCWIEKLGMVSYFNERSDSEGATRRAIVRAAAAIEETR